MTRLFSVGLNSRTTQMVEEASTQEAAHLHRLIETNPDLILGREIAPENPPQWFVIKSEVPIADPESGQDRWSLDLLLGDQKAWPALVECKLMKNAEIRREIIGQAIEYAANAQHYWEAAQLKKHALDRCEGQLGSLERRLRAIGWSESVDGYFEALVRNLDAGQFRLIFAVDDAPYRLRSTVEFLNRELETIEAVIVEIRRYQTGAEQLVSSGVLGYTEEIRHAKREATARQGSENHDEEGFMSGIRALQISGLDNAATRLLDGARDRGWTVRFSNRGNLLVAAAFSDSKTMFGVDCLYNGSIEWHIGVHEEPRPELASILRSLAQDTGAASIGPYPQSSVEGWMTKVESILEQLDALANDS